MRVLIVFDGSPESEAALQWGTKLVGCDATVLGVRPKRPVGRGYRGRPHPKPIGYATREQLEQAVSTLSKAGVPSDVIDKEGSPGPSSILEVAAADAFDLIVLAVYRQSWLQRLLFGSTAESVARHGSVPVLLVRLPAGK